MRLRADDPKAQQLRACLLNKKVVPMCYEADEEEGWVKSWMPSLPDGRAKNGEELVTDVRSRAGYDLVKRTGEVKLVFHKPSTD